MSEEKVHIKSTVSIEINTAIDLSAASEIKMLYADPHGELGSFDATYVDTTYARYVTGTTDIITAGKWKFQVKATIGGKPYHGDEVGIEFFRILE